MERKKNPSAFIRNTYTILQRQDLNHIIAWNNSQDGFIIHDLPKFQVEILPQYFKHQKYTSFVRQLNMYGFHKQRHPTSDNYFQHESFRRGQDLLQIKRKPEKKKKGDEDNALNSQQQIMKQNSSQQNPQMAPKYFVSPHKQEINAIDNVCESGNQIILNQLPHNNNSQLQNVSLHSLCEQAIRQNQSFTSIQGHIMSTALAIKKFKLKRLLNQTDQNDQSIRETLSAFQKMIRAETDKMSLFIDFLSF